MADGTNEAFEILQRIEQELPRDNPRLRSYMSALRESLEADSRQIAARQEELDQFKQAYEKLTQPANRIGVFLKWIEDANGEKNALILLGDSDYVVKFDPNLDVATLTIGTRVRLNEGYAIVATAPPSELGSTAKVSDVVGTDRLRIGSDVAGMDQRIILKAESLNDADIKIGDEVRLDSSGKIAIEHLAKAESRDYFMEKIPDIEWNQIGGQDDAIRLIRETIEQPLLYPEVFAKYGKRNVKGVLLYGPPGCGKTLIGKATAHNLAKEYSKRQGKEVKEYFMTISGPKILNMWVGETERMVRDIFRTARERAKDGYLVFIFMDEAESLLRTRSSGRNFSMSNTVVPQFCAELDGLEELDNVVLMLTSNRPDYIDPAILRPGRIDRKVKVIRPSKETAKDILGIYLHKDLPIDPLLNKKNEGSAEKSREVLIDLCINSLWSKNNDNQFLTINFRNGKSEILTRGDLISGALLESIIDRAKETAIRRTLSDLDTPTGLNEDDILSALNQEFTENAIFPKTDAVEDWLQLLDIERDNIVTIKPMTTKPADKFLQKSIV
jgi:proteasome-associated ATPase